MVISSGCNWKIPLWRLKSRLVPLVFYVTGYIAILWIKTRRVIVVEFCYVDMISTKLVEWGIDTCAERNWGTNIVNIKIKKERKSCKVGVIATFACGIGGWGDLEERVIDWTAVIESWLVQNDVDDDEQVVMGDG